MKGEIDMETVEMSTQDKIRAVFQSIAELVLEKNRRYGDSAINPTRISSKSEAEEGIKIRLDDKLSRVKNAGDLRKNDTADIIGYLGLLCVSNGWLDFSDLID